MNAIFVRRSRCIECGEVGSVRYPHFLWLRADTACLRAASPSFFPHELLVILCSGRRGILAHPQALTPVRTACARGDRIPAMSVMSRPIVSGSHAPSSPSSAIKAEIPKKRRDGLVICCEGGREQRRVLCRPASAITCSNSENRPSGYGPSPDITLMAFRIVAEKFSRRPLRALLAVVLPQLRMTQKRTLLVGPTMSIRRQGNDPHTDTFAPGRRSSRAVLSR